MEGVVHRLSLWIIVHIILVWVYNEDYKQLKNQSMFSNTVPKQCFKTVPKHGVSNTVPKQRFKTVPKHRVSNTVPKQCFKHSAKTSCFKHSAKTSCFKHSAKTLCFKHSAISVPFDDELCINTVTYMQLICDLINTRIIYSYVYILQTLTTPPSLPAF